MRAKIENPVRLSTVVGLVDRWQAAGVRALSDVLGIRAYSNLISDRAVLQRGTQTTPPRSGLVQQVVLSFSDIMPDSELSERLLAGKASRIRSPGADSNARVRRENLSSRRYLPLFSAVSKENGETATKRGVYQSFGLAVSTDGRLWSVAPSSSPEPRGYGRAAPHSKGVSLTCQFSSELDGELGRRPPSRAKEPLQIEHPAATTILGGLASTTGYDGHRLATSMRSRVNFLRFDMPSDTKLLERLYRLHDLKEPANGV